MTHLEESIRSKGPEAHRVNIFVKNLGVVVQIGEKQFVFTVVWGDEVVEIHRQCPI